MTKKIDVSGIISFFRNLISEKNLNILRSFFMGKWYPIWVAFSVLIGRVTGLELYFAMLDFVLVATSLLVCDSVRPVLPNLITFIFRIPLEHGPGYPNYSTYYSGAKLVFFFIFAAFFFVALAYFYVKNKVFVGVNILKTPLFIPLSVFSLAFFIAGIFSGNRSDGDVGFAFLQVFVFFVVFLILYYGLRKENAEELMDYFVYISAMCAIVLDFEVLDLFLRVDGVMASGSINKYYVEFGWGISNTCGSALSVMTPMCILGAMRAKEKYKAIIYYVIGALTATATFFTLARTSVLVGTIGFIISIVISCFAGKQKNVCRVATIILALTLAILWFGFDDKIAVVFMNYVQKGLDDSGRYELWAAAWEHFKGAPVFGNGFFSLPAGPHMATFVPSQAHNTFLQLLSSMGLFGLISYVVYRVYTIIPFLKNFSIYKFMLATSCGILVFESLIDNFIFWFSPTFVYNLCIIIAIMHVEQAKNAKTDAVQNAVSEESGDGNMNDNGQIDDTVECGAESEQASSAPSEPLIHDSPINDATVTTINL